MTTEDPSSITAPTWRDLEAVLAPSDGLEGPVGPLLPAPVAAEVDKVLEEWWAAMDTGAAPTWSKARKTRMSRALQSLSPEQIEAAVQHLADRAVAREAPIAIEPELALEAAWSEDPLVRKALQQGIPAPEDFTEANPYQAQLGGRDELRKILAIEAAQGRPLANQTPQSGSFYNYLGAAGFPDLTAPPASPFRDIRTLDGLIAALSALLPGTRARVTGGGHSSSEVARPDGVWLRMGDMTDIGMGSPFDTAPPFTQAAEPGWQWVRVAASTQVRAANRALFDAGLSLDQLGSYDAQSLWGAICTGTHGSGAAQGILADMVGSLDIAVIQGFSGGVPQVQLWRVEPTNGITHRAAFEADPRVIARKWKLIQNDAAFDALRVSMGCMGAVFAITLKVRKAFGLHEVRELRRTPIASVKPSLFNDVLATAAPADPLQREQIDLNVNPYLSSGKLEYIYSRRTVTALPPPGIRFDDLPGHTPKDLLIKLKRMGPSRAAGTVRLSNLAPGMLIGCALKGTAGELSSYSSKVFLLGAGRWVTASSCEIAVPFARTADAIKAIVSAAKVLHNQHTPYTTPFGVRFVRASSAPLAPCHRVGRGGVDVPLWTYVEVPGQLYVDGWREMIDAAEDALMQLDGRPHWGQQHRRTYGGTAAENGAKLRALYGDTAVRSWLSVLAFFDPQGVFDNPFTDRMGFRALIQSLAVQPWSVGS